MQTHEQVHLGPDFLFLLSYMVLFCKSGPSAERVWLNLTFHRSATVPKRVSCEVYEQSFYQSAHFSCVSYTSDFS